jgi:hypothetical protein
MRRAIPGSARLSGGRETGGFIRFLHAAFGAPLMLQGASRVSVLVLARRLKQRIQGEKRARISPAGPRLRSSISAAFFGLLPQLPVQPGLASARNASSLLRGPGH